MFWAWVKGLISHLRSKKDTKSPHLPFVPAISADDYLGSSPAEAVASRMAAEFFSIKPASMELDPRVWERLHSARPANYRIPDPDLISVLVHETVDRTLRLVASVPESGDYNLTWSAGDGQSPAARPQIVPVPPPPSEPPRPRPR